jgi:hypothetical protein
MSVIPVEEPPGAASCKATSLGFWQSLARALDEFFAYRTRRAVPEVALRRSKHEVERCRRLMLKGVPTSQRRVGQTAAQPR